MKIIIQGQPLPKPRQTRKSWFHYKKYWDYLEDCSWQVKQQKIKYYKTDIKCTIYFYRKGRLKADIDNLLKTTLELLQKTLIVENDNQVTEIHSKVVYQSDNPRAEIKINEIS